MARLLEERAVFVGAATAAGRLYDLGRFPGMVEADGPDQWVHGDLYEAPEEATIQELDRYENAGLARGMAYERKPAEVTLADGGCVEAWIYWYRGPVEEAQRIVSGDYFP